VNEVYGRMVGEAMARQCRSRRRTILLLHSMYGVLHQVRGYRIRCIHRSACHTIGFLLILTVSGADGQFSLQTNNLFFRCKLLGFNQLRHTPVAQHPLQLMDRMESTVK